MEVYNTKGVIIMYPLAAFFAMLVVLLNGYCCGAAVIVKSNTTFRCSGRLDECLLEDDLELEFLMNPYVSRLLLDPDPLPDLNPGTEANDPKRPVFKACGRYDPKNRVQGVRPYHDCVAKFLNNNAQCNVKNIYAGKGCP